MLVEIKPGRWINTDATCQIEYTFTPGVVDQQSGNQGKGTHALKITMMAGDPVGFDTEAEIERVSMLLGIQNPTKDPERKRRLSIVTHEKSIL